MKKCLQMFLLTLIFASQYSVLAAEELSYVDLVSRLTDLKRLALAPEEGAQCLQWSSYDRRSQYNAERDAYVNWGANNDGFGIIRTEGDLQVLTEMEGPGCIWRIWSADARDGHVKIYLDGQANPAIDLPFDDYFTGFVRPFDFPQLCYTASKGRNCYVPISFQKSCKIVAEENWGRYYQFTYTLFPEGTTVPTFKGEHTDEETKALMEVDSYLQTLLGKNPDRNQKGEKEFSRTLSIPSGETVRVADIVGPRAITSLQVVPPEFADREEEIATLRELVLQIAWDGEKEPSVWSPVGDFFGTAPGINLYKSLPLGMTEDGFYSYWYMPFAEKAAISVTNDGDVERELEFTITHAELERDIDDYGRFHAKWHRDAFIPADPDRWPDWTMLKTNGKGRFCGVSLHIWSPRGGGCKEFGGEGHWWWGEGDEKYFVDGEKFPSTFGTGTEDYFGYAWCHPGRFTSPYHNQPINEQNAGHASNNRWLIADNVPFQSSFEAALEKYFPNRWPTLYAATVYWYLDPKGEDPYLPVHVWDRKGYWKRTPPEYVEEDALEAEDLKVLKVTGGVYSQQLMSPHGAKWSNDKQLFWQPAEKGEKITIEVPVEKSGKHEVLVGLTKSWDYAVVAFRLNDKEMHEPLDLYSENVTATGPVSLGIVTLNKGPNELEIEVVSENEAVPEERRYFGIDFIKLVPVD